MASLDAKPGFEEVTLLIEVIDTLKKLLESKADQEGLLVLLHALQFVLQGDISIFISLKSAEIIDIIGDECACGHHIDDVTTALTIMYNKLAVSTISPLLSMTCGQRLAELQLKLHTVYQVQESHNQVLLV